MTNLDMARSYLRRAQIILQEAEGLFREQVWNLVVRRAQEAVELALKGLLRYAGLEVPHVHDLAGYLRQNQERLPRAVSAQLDRLISISRRLSEEREISFYGDEVLEVPPEELYTQQDAEAALAEARIVLGVCSEAVPKP
jgi:HEPN domain-containing protein